MTCKRTRIKSVYTSRDQYASFSGSTTEYAKSAKLTKLEARRDIPFVRELELSMSPIGRPSVLDVMDVTDVSADDQELSLYGPEPVKNQPRMSTHKLPHLIKREGSEDCSKFDTKVCVCTSQGSFSIYRNKRGNLPAHRPPPCGCLRSSSPFKLCMLHMHACT